jgi:hypothetical protein
MDVTPIAQYVKRQANGVTVQCAPEEADALLSTTADKFFPLESTGYIGDGHMLAEVEEVPPEVVPGYYFYHAGEFYAPEEELARLARDKAQAPAQLRADVDFISMEMGVEL